MCKRYIMKIGVDYIVLKLGNKHNWLLPVEIDSTILDLELCFFIFAIAVKAN